MSSDTWNEIQAVKGKQNSLREKLAKRKREREGLLAGLTGPSQAKKPKPSSVTDVKWTANTSVTGIEPKLPSLALPIQSKPVQSLSRITHKAQVKPQDRVLAHYLPENNLQTTTNTRVEHEIRPVYEITSASQVVEKACLKSLCNSAILLPLDVSVLTETISREMNKSLDPLVVDNLLQKFAAQKLLNLLEKSDKQPETAVEFIDHIKLKAVSDEIHGIVTARYLGHDNNEDSKQEKLELTTKDESSLEDLLSAETAKEKENKKINAEIMELLGRATAKEKSLHEKFRSTGDTLQDFCQYSTRNECKLKRNSKNCNKLHFKKIIAQHTDELLGDCSFLNTCFHMDTCKYVHYEIDFPEGYKKPEKPMYALTKQMSEVHAMVPPQWVCCDLRTFDMAVLGNCEVIMADPPWDIHMELPYGTMGDDEMRTLSIPLMQKEGFIFLWVTGRAMELGRECLELWGYDRVDEVLWVKTNQLQRIIRTGRTGHWFNHGKEHCLVGVKGNPKCNKSLDSDVIVAEVRATSHKPDEIYGIIERLMPGSRKLELFGRMHNCQPNWITLGNQLDGIRLLEPDIVKRYRKIYPDGYKI